jgi:aspartate/methionine/tyrosine aminotransferase
MKAMCHDNMDKMVAQLNAIPAWTAHPAQGGFYLFPDFSAIEPSFSRDGSAGCCVVVWPWPWVALSVRTAKAALVSSSRRTGLTSIRLSVVSEPRL